MMSRAGPLLVALFAGLLCASCVADGGHRRSSGAVYRCDDTLSTTSAFPCNLRDRDGFDRSDRHRDHPDHDHGDHDPPPFAGKDS